MAARETDDHCGFETDRENIRIFNKALTITGGHMGQAMELVAQWAADDFEPSWDEVQAMVLKQDERLN